MFLRIFILVNFETKWPTKVGGKKFVQYIHMLIPGRVFFIESVYFYLLGEHIFDPPLFVKDATPSRTS